MEHLLQTRLRHVLPKCEVHVLHGFVKIQIWDRVSMSTDEQFPRIPKQYVLCQILFYNVTQLCRGMTPTYHRAAFNETLFQLKRFQARFLVFQAKTRGRRASQGVVDTTSFANPAVQTELLSNTSVCRQLHHRRLLLLDLLLQMTILPPVSDDSNARISETCSILCLATTRRVQ